MNADDFEKRLTQQSMRPIPRAWREEVLAAARQSRPRPANGIRRPLLRSVLRSFSEGGSTLNHQLSTLLWPHPKAWAGLAGAWLVILLLNLPSTKAPHAVAHHKQTPTAEWLMVLNDQRRLFTEFLGPDELRVAAPPRPAPRSMRREEEWMA